MTNKEELYQQYEEALGKIKKEAHEAREKARLTLREGLKVLREEAHKELKNIRLLEQKTKGGQRK